MSQQRYIPPHARRGLARDKRDRPMSLEERFKQEEIVVILRSKTTHQDLPGQMIQDEQATKIGKSPTEIKCQKFKLQFQYGKLRDLMRWFRNIGRNDSNAVIEFPSSLDKEQRREIHNLANNFGLGTSSQGFGDQRYISVYTAEIANLGIGKLSLTPDEKTKSEEIWYLVKKFGGQYSKYSHNEINEMIIGNKLDPVLQDLLDTNQDLLAEEFKGKCNIADDSKNKT